MTKSNKHSIFDNRDSIPQNRKCECTNEAQALVVWAFSNFNRNLRNFIGEMVAKYAEAMDLDNLPDPDFYLRRERIRQLYTELYKEKNITQLELSRRTGIATSNISDWKKKKTNPKADCLLSICDALEITPEQLLTGKGIDPEYKDEDANYEVTRSDIKILKQIHSLGDEQYKRLMAYMKALSKVNYRIHTDAVKENLIPPELTPEQIAYTYASEADLLNVALFGQTAKQWKNNNPGKKGNVRDDANLNQLLVLANMESYNAILIEQGKSQSERLILLRNLAIRQMDTLVSINLSAVSALPGGDI